MAATVSKREYKSDAAARVNVTLLQLVRDNPGLTTQALAEMRGRNRNTVADMLNRQLQRGNVKPDRELPMHWTITLRGEQHIKDMAYLFDHEDH
jgi:hypothetical protein